MSTPDSKVKRAILENSWIPSFHWLSGHAKSPFQGSNENSTTHPSPFCLKRTHERHKAKITYHRKHLLSSYAAVEYLTSQNKSSQCNQRCIVNYKLTDRHICTQRRHLYIPERATVVHLYVCVCVPRRSVRCNCGFVTKPIRERRVCASHRHFAPPSSRDMPPSA